MFRLTNRNCHFIFHVTVDYKLFFITFKVACHAKGQRSHRMASTVLEAFSNVGIEITRHLISLKEKKSKIVFKKFIQEDEDMFQFKSKQKHSHRFSEWLMCASHKRCIASNLQHSKNHPPTRRMQITNIERCSTTEETISISYHGLAYASVKRPLQHKCQFLNGNKRGYNSLSAVVQPIN